MQSQYDAVLFDLLTALLDSWALWNEVAGSASAGQVWRTAYLRRTYQTGAYRPYEEIVAEAAAEVSLPRTVAKSLWQRWMELRPWPEVHDVLGTLHPHLPLAVVTNCSEELAFKAAACVGIPFKVVISAEQAGFYKPAQQPYRLALKELGVTPERTLFVAGSAYDLFGTAAIGLSAFWHNRMGMELPLNAPRPLTQHRSLLPLIDVVFNDTTLGS